jgi:hypothetical protein
VLSAEGESSVSVTVLLSTKDTLVLCANTTRYNWVYDPSWNFTISPVTLSFRSLSVSFATRVYACVMKSAVRRDADLTPYRLFGFLLGTATAGAGMYYYVIDEYRVSNQLLTEDIYALQSAVQRIEGYVRTLEEKVGEKRR